MNLEDFNKLTNEEKTALLTSIEKTSSDLKEKEIELESFRKENEAQKGIITNQEEELKKTKELNYTLARSVDSSKNKMSFEDALHGLLKGENK